ncbi:hypothetical protein, partial [Aliarcobacter butzleri]|uniref:hypothetical protein n=1 Tax=Aliarcobacter butzleri TaxID=28197 RepID=UPI003AF8AC78
FIFCTSFSKARTPCFLTVIAYSTHSSILASKFIGIFLNIILNSLKAADIACDSVAVTAGNLAVGITIRKDEK